MNQIILLSGPPGAGKSSVAEALCERFDRMLLVEVDDLRHMVRAGYRHPWIDDKQAREQLQLGALNAAAIALQSVALRYSVVIADVITAETVEWYRDALAGSPASIELVTLLPGIEETQRRDADRSDPLSLPRRIVELHQQFTAEVAAGTLPGAALDTSGDGAPAATADRVQDAIARGHALFLTPHAAEAAPTA